MKAKNIFFGTIAVAIIFVVAISIKSQLQKASMMGSSQAFPLPKNVSLPVDIKPRLAPHLLAESKAAVLIIVDPVLKSGIRIKLNRFKNDLAREGYRVIEKVERFQTPPQLRQYLFNTYTSEKGVIGTIFIGNFPRVYQFLTLDYTNRPSTTEEVLSIQYYSDLNGVFRASENYSSPGGHTYSYDIHEGDTNWEIWVGILPFDASQEISKTTLALNNYFDKNHAYRTGQGPDIPRSFLEIDEHRHTQTLEEYRQALEDFRDGTYAWTPFSTGSDALYYIDAPAVGLNVDQGYQAMSDGVADFTETAAHGWAGASGRIDIDWVMNNPVKTFFYWSDGCAVGNLDVANNFLTAILYSPTSEVLIAKGTTNDSGGMGSNLNGFYGHNIATSLDAGKSFGQALLDHVNVSLRWPWSEHKELHFGTPVTLGDPTLRLRD